MKISTFNYFYDLGIISTYNKIFLTFMTTKLMNFELFKFVIWGQCPGVMQLFNKTIKLFCVINN